MLDIKFKHVHSPNVLNFSLNSINLSDDWFKTLSKKKKKMRERERSVQDIALEYENFLIDFNGTVLVYMHKSKLA